MFTLIDYNGPAVEGQRVRKITNWKLLRNSEGKYYISGITISENNNLLTDRIRYTTSSPIVRRIDNTLITESGSKYTLESAHEEQDPSAYLVIPT